MSRWRLSTVRALGGHDTSSRLFHPLNLPTLRPSRYRFIRVCVDAAVPVANLVEESGLPVAASSSAQSCPVGPQDAPPALRFANILKNRESGRAAGFRVSYSAINTLRRLLSPENVASNQPVTHSPATIRALYYRAESRNQLGMLDARMLSLLISLFGSLSINPCVSIAYRHPLASHFLGTSMRRTHWAFVLKVGRYKSGRGIPLQDSDRCWLMRAELAMVQAKLPSKSLSEDAYNAILRARTHYHAFRRHSRRPESHTYYLETLLTTQDSRLFDFAASDLSFLLRNHRVCHPWLQRLLHRLVIQYGELLSTRSQETILAALWIRACQGTGGTSSLVPENGLSDITLSGSILGTTTIARLLSSALFGTTDVSSNDRSAILIGHLLSVFSPTYALPLRWGSLMLFSIFNSPGISHSSGVRWTSGHATPQIILYWQVIFGLATMEMAEQKPSSATAMRPSPTEGVLQTTHSLYQMWRPIIRSALVSQDLVCAVAISFFRIATIYRDATLFYDCRDVCYPESSSEGPRTSMQQLLAAQYLAAAVRVQGPFPDMVLRVLETASSDSKQQHQQRHQQRQHLVASAIEILAPIDASLAHTLYTVTQGNGTELDSEAVYALALSFVQHGAFLQAILFLNSGHFSVEKRGIVVSAFARSLRENLRTRHPTSVLVAIVNELAALYHSHIPPEHFRGHLEQLFVSLTQYGRGSQLYPVIISIFKRSPSFFQPRFFVRYSHLLVRHRQFSIARKVLDAIAALYPKVAQSLRIFSNQYVLRTRAFRVFKRVTLLRGPTSLRLSSRLRRRPCAGPRLDLSLQELLKSGRVLAAKHIFACAAVTISSKRRTALGNILLHGVSRQAMPRNGRRVRKVLALLESLVENHNFRPDRVTANILIKVMISWRSAFDSTRLRELFDRLVRGEYPAADYSPLRPPFGTRHTQLSGSSGFSKLPSFISFEKHTRPLLKMFVKAFYLCNDVEAARKVVGILKVEECKNAAAKEVRRKARSKGMVEAECC